MAILITLIKRNQSKIGDVRYEYNYLQFLQSHEQLLFEPENNKKNMKLEN